MLKWKASGQEKDLADIDPEATARRFYITADGTIVPTDEGGREVKIGSVYETTLHRWLP